MTTAQDTILEVLYSKEPKRKIFYYHYCILFLFDLILI